MKFWLSLAVTMTFGMLPHVVQAESRLGWASGVGTESCENLELIPESNLISWVKGYWTGANLYLGGTDLCLERASIETFPQSRIKQIIQEHCSEIGGASIMFAAFNALKSLPTIEGSRAAACERS